MSSEDLWREIYGGRQYSGVEVNWKSALAVATVQACVRKLASGVSQVPFRVYQDDGERKRVAADHPVNTILYRRPNNWQTSFEFRETMMFHLGLVGNFYAWKGMVGRERNLRTLEPIEPQRVTVHSDRNGVTGYEVRADDGATVKFRPDEIWHVRGPSWNGFIGFEAVKLAAEAIGLSMAAEKLQSDLFGNGARVSGLLSVEGNMGVERFQSLSKWLEKHESGGERSGKPMILDNGAKFSPYQMTGVDAQHLETREFQIKEICRAFDVMPIMIGAASETSTYASAEQMFIAHVVHTLGPWYERIEQSADLNLLSEADRQAGYYTKLTPNALMRGAAKDRAEFYTKALGAGGHGAAWMTPNEVRKLEELDPIEGGDELPSPPVKGAEQDAKV